MNDYVEWKWGAIDQTTGWKKILLYYIIICNVSLVHDWVGIIILNLWHNAHLEIDKYI